MHTYDRIAYIVELIDKWGHLFLTIHDVWSKKSTDLSKSNNDIEEESLEETIPERNRCVYGSNDTRLLKVSDIVINIESVMESEIVVTFENERNYVLTGLVMLKIILLVWVKSAMCIIILINLLTHFLVHTDH